MQSQSFRNDPSLAMCICVHMHTLSPRSMNLMATCCPVVLSIASSTKPKVPLFRSRTFLYLHDYREGMRPD